MGIYIYIYIRRNFSFSTIKFLRKIWLSKSGFLCVRPFNWWIQTFQSYLWPYFWVWSCNWNLIQLSKILLICPNLTLFWPFYQAHELDVIPPPPAELHGVLIGQFEIAASQQLSYRHSGGSQGVLPQKRIHVN